MRNERGEGDKENRETPIPYSWVLTSSASQILQRFVLATGKWSLEPRTVWKPSAHRQKNSWCFRPPPHMLGISGWYLVIFSQEAKMLGTQLLWREREWKWDCKEVGSTVDGAWKWAEGKDHGHVGGLGGSLDTLMLSSKFLSVCRGSLPIEYSCERRKQLSCSRKTLCLQWLAPTEIYKPAP